MERYYADVASKSVTTSSNKISVGGKGKSSKIIDCSFQSKFRVQGIPENLERSRNENFKPRNEKLVEFLNSLGVSPKIEPLRRMRKFDKGRCKQRTLLVTMTNEYDVRLLRANGTDK